MRAITILAAVAALFSLSKPTEVKAQDCIMGSIHYFGMDWCPRNFVPADGQLISIPANEALFSLFGTTYGGDGRTSFGLPDLRGRAPIGHGQGPGMQSITIGANVGNEFIGLSENQIPPHDHAIRPVGNPTLIVQDKRGDTRNPDGAFLAVSPGAAIYTKDAGRKIAMANGAVSHTLPKATAKFGKGKLVFVRSPALAITPCICYLGIYPSRN